MNTPQELAQQMTQKTDQQLLEMFNRPADWTAEALEAAEAELQARKRRGQAPETGADSAQQWKMDFRIFRGTIASWDELFSDAAEFATELGPERVLSVSHSADHHDGVVTVWYWRNALDGYKRT
jgi:hypothetical protein